MKNIFPIVVFVLFGVLLTLLLAEWLVGCGESYVDANGVRHINPCIIVR